MTDDKVLLYSNGSGIIARGIADGQVKKKDDNVNWMQNILCF